MPGPGTNFEAPLLVGTRPQSSPTTPQINDYGSAVLEQRVTLVANSTTAVTANLYLPIGSVLLDITEDTTTAWSSGTAVATVGTAAADTTYAGSTDVHAAGRARPAFSPAQLLAMGNVVAPAEIFITVTPTGATSGGQTVITLEYAPTVQTGVGNT
jgi:hypothetical protein